MDALNDTLGHIDEDLTVETSIDARLQASAEISLADELTAKGNKFGVSQGALVAMTPDGAVRASSTAPLPPSVSRARHSNRLSI